MFQGQIGEIPLLNPGKLGLFLILALFFHPYLPKNWAFPPSSKLLVRIDMRQAYPLKTFRLDKLRSTVSVSNCKKAVFNYIFLQKVMKSNW